ncbi:hypothetical protein FA15DRAFT_671198 [Coprinopsis marcescibilis]|uniref:Uncharacterized protein n=1 Tax=Coprinopsis marcescibilis TaxID=230819 RepID=A0A5C3KQR0_COPMA|nr:hypothetical protein FA15DRAFT_671198 [Coprinopsis marcescibilis]
MPSASLRVRLAVQAVVICLSQAAQVPFRGRASGAPQSSFEADSQWRFDAHPPANATGNFIFDGVSSLLQQWANTHYRNGHNIVPATIPVGTLLYHGTNQKVLPAGPEWTAVDPEHSYFFCRAPAEGEGCYHLTLAATRPLNLLYFDGSSAAKMYGTMDSQDMIIWGEIKSPYNEWERIISLCDWGKKYDLDGFLRMEPDFEIMLCDFKNGVEPVSFLNLRPAGTLGPPGVPPHERRQGKVSQRLNYGLIEAGQWHNRFPGDTRITLDLGRLISFYDLDMFPSLVEGRLNQERFDHRVAGIDKEDMERLLARVDEVLTSKPVASGVDWSSLYRVVIHRYADRLELLRYMLNSTGTDSSSRTDKVLHDTHEFVGSMLSPYILNDAQPSNPPSQGSPQLSWASPVFELCATTHTKYIKSLPLTTSERLMLRSVNEVLHEICRVVVGIWAEGIELNLTTGPDFAGSDSEPWTSSKSAKVRERWHSKVVTLMGWLDWSVWVKCRPACGFEEMCYLPTWPFFRNSDGRIPTLQQDIPQDLHSPDALRPPLGYKEGQWERILRSWELERYNSTVMQKKAEAIPDSNWTRPKPRCARRLQPFDFCLNC